MAHLKRAAGGHLLKNPTAGHLTHNCEECPCRDTIGEYINVTLADLDANICLNKCVEFGGFKPLSLAVDGTYTNLPLISCVGGKAVYEKVFTGSFAVVEEWLFSGGMCIELEDTHELTTCTITVQFDCNTLDGDDPLMESCSVTLSNGLSMTVFCFNTFFNGGGPYYHTDVVPNRGTDGITCVIETCGPGTMFGVSDGLLTTSTPP